MQGTRITLKTPLKIDVKEITRNITSTLCFHGSEPRANGDHDVTRNPGIEELDNMFIKMTIFSFRGRTAAGFTEIYSDYDVIDLRELLEGLPQDLLDKLGNAFTEAGLDLFPELTSEEKAEQEQDKAKREVFAALYNLPQNDVVATFLPSEVKYVYQREISLTDSKNQFPVLVSSGATSCLILSAFNITTHMAALTHIDAYITADSVIENLKKLQVQDSEEIVLDIVGGNKNSQQFICPLLIKLRECTWIKIRSADLDVHSDRSQTPKALSIDSRTGEIANQFTEAQLPFDIKIKKTLMLSVMRDYSRLMWKNASLDQPLKVNYDGRQKPNHILAK